MTHAPAKPPKSSSSSPVAPAALMPLTGAAVGGAAAVVEAAGDRVSADRLNHRLPHGAWKASPPHATRGASSALPTSSQQTAVNHAKGTQQCISLCETNTGRGGRGCRPVPQTDAAPWMTLGCLTATSTLHTSCAGAHAHVLASASATRPHRGPCFPRPRTDASTDDASMPTFTAAAAVSWAAATRAGASAAATYAFSRSMLLRTRLTTRATSPTPGHAFRSCARVRTSNVRRGRERRDGGHLRHLSSRWPTCRLPAPRHGRRR